MTVPTFVGAVQADGGSTGGNTYTTSFATISPADGDYLVWAIMIEVTGATLTTAPAGWTQRYSSTSVGSRTVLIYDKIWHTGDATSLSYVKSTANADGNVVAAYRGVSSLSYGTGQRRADQSPTNSFTNTAPSITTTVADTLALGISLEATSAAETGTFQTVGPTMPSGWTQDYYKAQGTTIQTISLFHKAMSTAGATGDAIVTYQNTQASNGYAVQIGLVPPNTPSATPAYAGTGTFSATTLVNYAVTAPFSGSGAFTAATGNSVPVTAPFAGTGAFTASVGVTYAINAPFSGAGTFSAPAQRPVDTWMANTPMFVAHRGGSASWPQHTMYAYDQSAAWNPNLALEVSVWKSADGVWVASHDQNTGTSGTWNASYDIPTTNWSVLSTVRSVTGNYPMIRLTDVLDKYGNSRIIFVEDKPNTDQTGFLNLLDSYAGSARYVVKAYYDNHSMSLAAHARGYRTWGYYYNADVASSATTYTDWDILGLETSATTPNWTTMKGYGRPVLAHIIQNTTQYAAAQAQSPAGYMVADVINVVPQTGTLVPISGAGSFSPTVGQQYVSASPSSGAGTFATTVSQRYATPSTSSGSGNFGGTVSQSYSQNAPAYGAGTFSATAFVSGTTLANIIGTGTFSAIVSQSYSVNLTVTGSGSLVFTVQQPSGSFEVFVWDGTTLVPATLGVWNGSSVVPAEILEIA